MRLLKFWFVPILILFCICIVVNNTKVFDLEMKINTFDVEIKGLTNMQKSLTNMQKSQMKFSTLQATINQLTFCLQATEIENEELSNTIQQAFQSNQMLRNNLQRANMFINQLLQDNAELKKLKETPNV